MDHFVVQTQWNLYAHTHTHTHGAKERPSLKYVNEPTWINSGHRGQNYQLPHRQICPQCLLSLQLCFRGKGVIYDIYQALQK